MKRQCINLLIAAGIVFCASVLAADEQNVAETVDDGVSAFMAKVFGQGSDSDSDSTRPLSEQIDMEKLAEAFANSDQESLQMLWAVLGGQNANGIDGRDL
jgi:hypothetical protein